MSGRDGATDYAGDDLGAFRSSFRGGDVNLRVLLEGDFLREEDRVNLKRNIASNPILSSLYEKDLLFFSISQKKKIIALAKNPKNKDKKRELLSLLAPENKLALIIEESLDGLLSAIGDTRAGKYNRAILSLLAQSKERRASKEISSSFEGVVLEAFPDITSSGQVSDYYSFEEQKIRICARNIPILKGMQEEGRVGLVLAHEGAHAIDDIYHETKSAGTVLRRFGDAKKYEDVKRLIGAASRFSEEKDSISKLYRRDFELRLKEAAASNRVGMKSMLDKWREAYDENVSKKLSNPLLNNKNTELLCGTLPAEFLGFHSENFFRLLVRIDDPERLKQERKRELSARKNILERRFEEKVVSEALKMLHEATASFYKEIGRDRKLKPYIKAMRRAEREVLEMGVGRESKRRRVGKKAMPLGGGGGGGSGGGGSGGEGNNTRHKSPESSAAEPDREWWDEEQLISSMKRQIGDRAKIKDPVISAEQLKHRLTEVGREEDGIYVVPLSVNALNGSFTDRNHYAGLIIHKDAGKIKRIDYVDPMGREINPEVKSVISGEAGVAEVAEVMSGRAIQKVEVATEPVPELTGNTYDCGPMLCFLCAKLVKEQAIPRINSLEESKRLGENLRQKEKEAMGARRGGGAARRISSHKTADNIRKTLEVRARSSTIAGPRAPVVPTIKRSKSTGDLSPKLRAI